MTQYGPISQSAPISRARIDDRGRMNRLRPAQRFDETEHHLRLADDLVVHQAAALRLGTTRFFAESVPPR